MIFWNYLILCCDNTAPIGKGRYQVLNNDPISYNFSASIRLFTEAFPPEATRTTFFPFIFFFNPIAAAKVDAPADSTSDYVFNRNIFIAENISFSSDKTKSSKLSIKIDWGNSYPFPVANPSHLELDFDSVNCFSFQDK